MTAFFVASKVGWGLIRVETWIVIALIVTLLALRRGRTRLAGWIVAATLGAFLAIGFLPLGDLVLRRIELTHPAPTLPSSADGIVILGGAEDASLSTTWKQPSFNDAGERIMTAVILSRAFPAAQVIVTGGSGALSDLGRTTTGPADVTSAMLTALGLDPSRLTVETQSRNTAENARLSYDVVQPQPGQVWLLVTSAFHMPRAARSFDAAGWTGIIPYPTDFRARPFRGNIGWDPDTNIHILNIAMREVVGMIAYRVFRQ